LWQFQKELRHSASSVVQTITLWDGADLPVDQWIGMKYVVYTQAVGEVKLQAWLDLTEGENGGDWQLLGEYIDMGSNWNADADWGSLDATGCNYDTNHVIDPGHGVVFIRNTQGESEYKWVTIREIELP
ncbi:MAG: hypothetical protein COA42_17670, partial [Alteromonadaceae bacterium]